jgi:hypothetical protein
LRAEAERLKRQASLVVTVEDQAETARLLIPRKLVRAWQHASLATPRDSAVASARGWSLSTLIAGLALALSLTVGGLWLTGRLPRFGGRGAALLLLAVLALGVVGALVRADVPPGPSPRPYIPLNVPKEFAAEPLTLKGKVEVEVVPEGEVIQLFLPRSMLAPLANQKAP